VKRRIELILAVILLVNFIGIGGFWILFLLKPTEPITLELGTHIFSEFATSLLCLISFIILVKKLSRLKSLMLITAGMLLYSSMQALGWAFVNQIYPLLALMVINILFILGYLVVTIRGDRLPAH